jgi:parallel beta-helix repeat protein
LFANAQKKMRHSINLQTHKELIMKNFSKVFVMALALVFIQRIQSYAQNNAGKATYTYDEVKRMCGVPIDPAKTSWLKAKQDSIYKDYISNAKNSKTISFNMASPTTIPPNWQWVMSDVEYQSCGDCWVHAATGIAEGRLSILYGSKLNIFMNELEVPNACNGGYPTEAENYIRNNKISSKTGPYPNLPGVRWTIASFSTVSGIDAIKSALANGPVAGCFYVYEDFYRLFNSNRTGVYHYDWDGNPGSVVGGHAVAIVSYNDSEQYWLCKNSWGSNWADNGYFRIGYGQCFIDTWENSTVTVDQSCCAKLIPQLIGSLSAACSYRWDNGERGYICDNHSVSGNISNLGNLTVQYGATLAIASGTTLQFANGVALTINGTLSTSTNIVIPSGVALEANQCAVFNFGPGNSLTVDGSIIANGTGSYPVRFQRLYGWGAWDKIHLRSSNNYFGSCVFDGGTYADVFLQTSNNNWFENCTFKNAALCGVKADWSYGNTFRNCAFVNNADGIVLWCGGSTWLDHNTINNNTYHGICMYYMTEAKFYSNRIENNGGYGIVVCGAQLHMGYNDSFYGISGYSQMFDQPTYGAGINCVNNNGSYQIYVDADGRLYVGNLVWMDEPGSGELAEGFNRISGTNGSYIYNLAMTGDYENQQQWMVPASRTYWNGSVGYGNFYGSVNWSYPLSSDPSTGAGAANPAQKVAGPDDENTPGTVMTSAIAA